MLLCTNNCKLSRLHLLLIIVSLVDYLLLIIVNLIMLIIETVNNVTIVTNNSNI